MSTRRPRYRYVAFRVDGNRTFHRGEMEEALRSMAPRLRLVVFQGTSGLVRTTHIDRDAAIHALNGIDKVGDEPVHVATIGTSGTIRAATKKYLSSAKRVRGEPEKNPYK